MTILYTILVAFGLAFSLGILLGFFKKIFYVEVDPKVEELREALPGANCGGCGFPGCDGFAAAVAKEQAPVDGCTAGGVDCTMALAKIMGIVSEAVQKVEVLACQGSKAHTPLKGDYVGVPSCKGAKIAVNGLKFCQFGCIGLADCVSSCQFGAIEIEKDGLPHINYDKCTGCAACEKACPQKLFTRIPLERKGAVALCSNRSENKASIMKQCKVGCIKCGKCERACTKKALVVTNGIPVVDYALCNSCGDCVTGCPTKVLKILETGVFAS
ncbi:MAG: RnfABCDGE type electron transport complex subunit B [Treponemataceae bacterium]